MRRMILSLVAVLAVAGCASDGDGEPVSTEPAIVTTTEVPVTCGEGTHLAGRECVTDPPASTAPSTTIKPIECGPGTHLLEAAKECRPDVVPVTTTTAGAAEPQSDTAAFYDSPAGRVMCVSTFDVAEIVAGDEFDLDEGEFNEICGVDTTTTAVATNESVPPADQLTAEEIAGALGEPLSAWMLQPSGPGFDAIVAASRSLLDSGRPLPAFTDPNGQNTDSRDVIEQLSAYPGEDWMVYNQADNLRPLIPSLPFVLFGGDYLVGAEVPAGTYRTTGDVDGCYWETLDSAGEINRNNFVSAAPQVIMTVRTSDYAVNTDGCGSWVRTG